MGEPSLKERSVSLDDEIRKRSTSSDQEEHTELEMEPSLKERSVSSLDIEFRKRARSTFRKRSLIAMSAHYLIMIAVTIGIFFLMVWHLSVHDHSGGHDHEHEHEHEH